MVRVGTVQLCCPRLLEHLHPFDHQLTRQNDIKAYGCLQRVK